MNPYPLGEMLVEVGAITRAQLEEALNVQKTVKGKLLGDILVSLGHLTEQQLMHAMEYRFKIPFYDLTTLEIPPEIAGYLRHETAEKHNVVPVGKEDRKLVLATADPMNFRAVDDVKLESKCDVKLVLATATAIRNTITKLYGKDETSRTVENLNKEFSPADLELLSREVGDTVDNAPVVKLADLIIRHAVDFGASDVHIEPTEDSVRIRYRIDGKLQERLNLTKSAHAAIVTRFKIMGNLDIAEKRLPQDGAIRWPLAGENVDLRISVLPTVNGEKIVLRILGGRGAVLSRKELGFTPENSRRFDEILKHPNGIILVAGPTGSGKTTTLYTVLNELNRPDVNIITVEDPVEYRIPGLNQVQINPKAGLSFADGLRSILRQDPDIIMVGEIRDAETAEIAVRASITGHLVLSTIHTNDTVSTVARLLDMGIEPYLLSASLAGVVSQRLVRKICEHCKTEVPLDAAEARLPGGYEARTVRRGKGCDLCGRTGYKGRTVVCEVLVMNRELRELIESGAGVDRLRHAAVAGGMTTLKENCMRLVREGVTTVEEMIRAVYAED